MKFGVVGIGALRGETIDGLEVAQGNGVGDREGEEEAGEEQGERSAHRCRHAHEM